MLGSIQSHRKKSPNMFSMLCVEWEKVLLLATPLSMENALERITSLLIIPALLARSAGLFHR
jgi:hypothetical protein